jgi:hypothetical protein
MDKTDFATLPILTAVTKATITGRPFLECGLIGHLCFRLPMEGFMSLFQSFSPTVIDDEKVRFHLRSVVAWYRTTGWPGFWSNEPLFEWLESQSLTREERLYSMYAALLLCVDRAVACGTRDRIQESEQWFDCAQWLRFSLASNGQALGVEKSIVEFMERHDGNLAQGRKKGSESQKRSAATRLENIERINADLLKHPDTARWTLEERAAHICAKVLKNPKVNEAYSLGSMVKLIQGKG